MDEILFCFWNTTGALYNVEQYNIVNNNIVVINHDDHCRNVVAQIATAVAANTRARFTTLLYLYIYIYTIIIILLHTCIYQQCY